MHDDQTSCINGKWKENESYQNAIEYNQNNLSIETQQLQERKMEHTFNIMTTSLRKHFDAWANRHLPLALWSEQPIAQAVASFLLNRPPQWCCVWITYSRTKIWCCKVSWVFKSALHDKKQHCQHRNGHVISTRNTTNTRGSWSVVQHTFIVDSTSPRL